IKPQNLLLFGAALKVGDFGLVHVRKGEGASYGGGLTAAYAPPEFFEGSSSRHSDQYSLAVTYCQLRGGRLPFRGRTLADFRQAHLRQAPDLSMLPEEERAVVGRALAKVPSARWPNCRT